MCVGGLGPTGFHLVHFRGLSCNHAPANIRYFFNWMQLFPRISCN